MNCQETGSKKNVEFEQKAQACVQLAFGFLKTAPRIEPKVSEELSDRERLEKEALRKINLPHGLTNEF